MKDFNYDINKFFEYAKESRKEQDLNVVSVDEIIEDVKTAKNLLDNVDFVENKKLQAKLYLENL